MRIGRYRADTKITDIDLLQIWEGRSLDLDLPLPLSRPKVDLFTKAGPRSICFMHSSGYDTLQECNLDISINKSYFPIRVLMCYDEEPTSGGGCLHRDGVGLLWI